MEQLAKTESDRRAAVMASSTNDNIIAVLTDELQRKEILVDALMKDVATLQRCREEADALKKKLAAAQDHIQRKNILIEALTNDVLAMRRCREETDALQKELTAVKILLRKKTVSPRKAAQKRKAPPVVTPPPRFGASETDPKVLLLLPLAPFLGLLQY